VVPAELAQDLTIDRTGRDLAAEVRRSLFEEPDKIRPAQCDFPVQFEIRELLRYRTGVLHGNLPSKLAPNEGDRRLSPIPTILFSIHYVATPARLAWEKVNDRDAAGRPGFSTTLVLVLESITNNAP